MAGERYFVRSRGKISGPYDLAGLQRLVKLGMLSRAHEVSADKQAWASAGTVPGVLPGPAAPVAAVGQLGVAPAADAADASAIAETPRAKEQPPPAFNGPTVACVSCGSVLPAAQLFNDQGRYICPSCYHRQTPAVPPTGQYPASEGGTGNSYHGYGVASLVLGIAGLVIPLLGLICSILAIVFGSVALGGNRRIGRRQGNGMARAGEIMGIIATSLYAIWFIVWIAILLSAQGYR